MEQVLFCLKSTLSILRVPSQRIVYTMEATSDVSRSSYDVLGMLGEGGFAHVLLVRRKDDPAGGLFAMKVVRKKSLSRRAMVHATAEVAAMRALAQSPHPFLARLHACFFDSNNLYLVTEFCGAKDLFSLIELGRLAEAQARFYVAEITLAIGHIHSNGYVYRDLKSENVMLCMSGHVKLVDFGFIRHCPKGTLITGDFCGTCACDPATPPARHRGAHACEEKITVCCRTCADEALSPEQLQRRPYGRPADWWALGCLTHELVAGYSPYERGSPLQTWESAFQVVMHTDLELNEKIFSDSAADFIFGLLSRDVTERLGSRRGAKEVTRHPFFRL